MKKLSGKNAFISGSSRGIGLACAKALAEQGANVFLVATNEVLLKEATSAIQERSAVQVGFHAVDLRTLEGCQQASNAFNKSFGQADILVNSAGATKGGIFPEQSDEEMIDGFALKFHGAVRLCRQQLRSRESPGLLVHGTAKLGGSVGRRQKSKRPRRWLTWPGMNPPPTHLLTIVISKAQFDIFRVS